MNEKQITKIMKGLGYDKITEIRTFKKEGHKKEHTHIYFDNKKVPYRSVVHMDALRKIIKSIQGEYDEKENM